MIGYGKYVEGIVQAALLAVLVLGSLAHAQTVSGVISGHVVDPSGLAIPAAAVTLTNEGTGEQREAVSAETGDFVFPAVLPGRYTVAVQASGMKRLERTNINMSSSQRLALGDLRLDIGAVTESVTVTAVTAQVQTQSYDSSAVLTPDQMQTLSSRARDFLTLVRVLPGVVYEPTTQGSEMLGITTGPRASGLPGGFNTYSVDGLYVNDAVGGDGAANLYHPINMDAISEVKVLLTNYPAEYGRAGGAIINAVTKSGTQQFHGGGYIYKRHEQFNATDFFNNLNGISKPRYRYTTVGASIGGPITWPGKFNSNRDKLFFFYSNETLRGESPQRLIQVTMPTALERAGDFSQSLDTNGRVIAIRDPLTGASFPNNTIPASRIDSNGQKILEIFPLPNQLDRTITRGNYNYNFQESLLSPKQNNVFRVDANVTSTIRMYFRGSLWRDASEGHALGGCQPSPAWGYLPCVSKYTDDAGTYNFTHVISPTLVHEFTASAHHAWELAPPLYPEDLDRYNRANRGMTIPQFYAHLNPYNIVPWASFGGVPSAARLATDNRFPKRTANTAFDFTDSLSWIRDTHSFKFGFFGERTRQRQMDRGTFAGDFDFGRDVNNPNDSNYAYSNAVLGNFKSYSESTYRIGTATRVGALEWYAQDNWKATRKLTLDYGVRMSYFIPEWSGDGLGAFFDPARFDPSKAVRLYEPARNPQGQRVARNPLNGELFPVALIGAIVPDSGEIVNGTVLQGEPGYGNSFVSTRGIHWGPRFGFAYDPFGDGKTSVRGGAGITYNHRGGGGGANGNPPTQFTPFIYYGSLNNFINTSSVLSPFSSSSADRDNFRPTVYNLSFGVQRDVGHQTVVDVAYVSTLGRHLNQTIDLNQIPYGARFLPQNQDPTTGRPLVDNFFRPYVGYTGLSYRENAGTSNYHSLQAQANRRFSRGLQFGLAWTWSKTMDYLAGGRWAKEIDHRIWNYGKADFDRTHVLAVNWLWEVPNASRIWNNVLTRAVLDNWQISGIVTLQSGDPLGISLGTVDGADITGGGDGVRPNVLAQAIIPKSERTRERYFNPDVFARPAQGDRGNAPRDSVRGPGTNNFDLSFFKDFPVKEQMRFTFRWEMFNAFNHTQFLGVDTSTRFDTSGRQTNARLGAITSSRNPRVMQGSLRFSF